MKYFVSIENTSYFHWQIELLIESFNRHSLEDDLIIAIANNDNPVVPQYKKNLLNHKNKFVHENFSPKCLNKTNSLWMAIKNGLITAPFAVIHPDMVMINPINPIDKDIVFSPQPETESIYKEPLSKYIEEIKKISKIVEEMIWLPVGDVIVFNTIPDYFFERLNINILKLINDFDNPSFKLEKAAWILTILESAIGLFAPPLSLGIRTLEQTLLHHGIETNFVHYKHGLPPEWSKYQYKFEGPATLMINEAGPYHSMIDSNCTSSTDIVCKLINSYSEKN